MKQIKSLVEFFQRFSYIVKIAKAALAGYEVFEAELAKSLEETKESTVVTKTK
jgi:hypothetical protein